jgi:glutamate dehydrogenase
MAFDAETAASGLIRKVQKALGKGSQAALLAPLLYARDGLSGLESLPADWLAANAREAIEFIADKPKSRHKICVRRIPASSKGALPEGSVVEILNDDMPFLVDSVLGELQARSLAVRFLFHPIFKTERDKAGRLQTITGAGDGNWSDGHQESYIAIHLRALPDADARDLAATLSDILAEVRVVVADWRAMLRRLGEGRTQLELAEANLAPQVLGEATAFLQWLEQANFTFLGAREFELTGDPDTGDLVSVEGSGLGVLRDAGVQVLRRGSELVAMTPEVRRFFFAPSPLIITKANVVSRVHRRAHMDYIGIKTYRSDGKPKGEIRFVGLFTSQAYVSSPGQIPVLRHKVETVLAASGYPAASHAGKALLNILDTFPRDELFQIETKALQEWAEGILDLETRPRVRLFTRVDRFDRFVSAIIYVPRDRYNTRVRERISALLTKAYQGRLSAFYPYFPEGPLVRVQFIVGRYDGPTPPVDVAELEHGIAEIVRTWEDRLADAIATQEDRAEALRAKYGTAFSAGYAEIFPAERALEDIKRIERLGPDHPVVIDFYRVPGMPANSLHAAVYSLGAPIPLSQRVPVLENLGFSAIDERSYHIRPRFEDGERDVALHDMVLETADGGAIALERHDKRLEGCFLAVLRGQADNDGFNRLIVSGGIDWREVAVLRAYGAYLRQLGSPFGLRYLSDTLNRHAQLACDLIELFHLRFDPHRALGPAQRQAAEAPIRQRIEAALAAVPSLDEDRILRQFHNLVDTTVRTSFYQSDACGQRSATLSFKLDSKAVEAAPQPRPFREIWVYSPRVEAIHLRFAPIARGGIRWSDRVQDFRTEILGLVRAQLVKNAVIVPSGAKGGFLPKQLPRTGGREEIQKEGVAAYRIFISALLDITDNLKDGKVIPPRHVVRHDADDPYLVVAADKGTATFSDIANDISAAHDFWLGDAFASGGSAGYDHKGMAITARGAWECVKRHFREVDVDIQREPFRVVGVGDMSGDVFGNGMLLSEHIQLVAAFDHRDVFIDPNPGAGGLAERRRLFDLPRSSWQDYDKARISRGGGVFSRAAKAIPLSDEMKRLLEVDVPSLPPTELIRAILKCKTDLLWFGGIGTYLRASTETDAEVGDRANDALRITAAEVRAKVIGEGANLGVTQRARIEFAVRGGRINTDFIDNSAGVNTSDQEVNIKIALVPAVHAGQLTLAARNKLLADMTEDVAAASLRNNYQQSLALSLAERRSAHELADYSLLMRTLEARGLFDRALEALPSDMELQERARAGRGLTRPELAVVLSFAKIALQHDLLESRVPDEPGLEAWLTGYFPSALRERFAGDIKKHSLRREIIALGLTNAIANRGGPAMAVRLAEETQRTTADVAYAFLAAREVFELPALWQRVDALDGKTKGLAQLALYQATQDLVNAQTLWFLRNGSAMTDLPGTIARHRTGVGALRSALATALSDRRKALLAAEQSRLAGAGIPADLGADVAELDIFGLAPSITEIVQATSTPMADAARTYLAIGEHLRISDLVAKAGAIPTPDYYDRLAVAQALGRLATAQAAFTRDAIRAGDAGGPEAWLARQGDRLARVRAMLEEIAGEGTLTVSRLLVAAGQLGDLAEAKPAAPSASARTGRAAGRARSTASGSPPARRHARQPRS